MVEERWLVSRSCERRGTHIESACAIQIMPYTAHSSMQREARPKLLNQQFKVVGKLAQREMLKTNDPWVAMDLVA